MPGSSLNHFVIALKTWSVGETARADLGVFLRFPNLQCGPLLNTQGVQYALKHHGI